ncbi:MAG TPA: outer membrane lipoprotein carrier protein LolA [Acidobacteriaceae bacterium]|nr:outer membrane lipoprotein carrier protein LolA [Acidobacteriaceae bacterium]
MKRIVWICATAALCALPMAQAQSCDAAKVLAQMDAASAKFQSTQADFKWDVLQSVVNEHDIQSGTIYFERRGATTSMAAYIKQPAEKTVFYNGSTLSLLQPEIKQETIFSANSQYESFLTLGFGGSGKDLQNNWTVSCQGMESIDGTQTAKLDLKPKQQSVANMFSHITVWIDPTRSLGLKQIFYEPSGDNRTATYTGIKYNAKIPAEIFKPKDKGYNVIRK